MHESQKLSEAKYFLSEMSAKRHDRDAFVHSTSAFLSAARSAAQYALKEAQGKPGGQAWYDDGVKDRSLMLFFKNERDLNIHTQPVRPRAIASTTAHNVVVFSPEADNRISRLDERGQPFEIATPVDLGSPSQKVPPAPTLAPPVKESEVRYEFTDRPGEDVQDLCQKYLDELMSLIDSGRQAGFLTA